MKARAWVAAVAGIIAILSPAGLPQTPDYSVAPTATDYCTVVAKTILRNWEKVKAGQLSFQDQSEYLPKDLPQEAMVPRLKTQAEFSEWALRQQVLDVVNAPSCFEQANGDAPNASARTGFWNAVESLSGSQQQGSSLPSSGSTSSISKPSGPSALVEEFGGVNVTRGTSSLTAQWSPGTFFANMVSTGLVPLCIPEIQTTHCISKALINRLAPLTFKVTSNTSSGTPSATGTATGGGSASKVQQVYVNGSTTKGPSFAGLTAQYAFNSRNSTAIRALTSGAPSSPAAQSYLKIVEAMLNEVLHTSNDFQGCDAYITWAEATNSSTGFFGKITSSLDKIDPSVANELGLELAAEYRQLFQEIAQSSMPACHAAVESMSELFLSERQARALEDVLALTQQSSNTVPTFALEYDLNTPQDQLAYSTVKGTLTFSWGNSGTVTQAATVAANQLCTESQSKLNQIAARRLVAQPNGAGTSPTQQPVSNSGACPAPQSIPTRNNQNASRRSGMEKKRGAQTEAVVAYARASGSGTTTTSTAAGSGAPAAGAKSAAQAVAKPWSLTVTGSGDLYNAEPPASIPSASHVRDLQAGAELAYLFAPSVDSRSLRTAIGDITLAGAYSYQDQTSPSILTGPALIGFTDLPSSTTSAYTKRGVIHLAQVRFGFGSGTSVSYPLSFTYSNRTELVTHPTWGVQFGVSYNLNSLFSSTSNK